ncbi:hypothetical protein F4823DRAFT_566832 [Ustulina deusta]|nr:hypothetical protein F4823DRAFT_566832 [Ustulina deusta]
MLQPHTLRPTWLILYFSISFLLHLAETTCYTQNGTETEDLVPCNATAKISACCQSRDFCLSNGLCMERFSSIFLLGGCTDPGFKTPCVLRCDVDEGFSSPVFRISYCGEVDEGDVFLCGDLNCSDPDLTTAFTEPAATALYEPITEPPDASTTKQLTRHQTVTATFTQTFTAILTQTLTLAFANPSSSATPSQAQPIALGLGLGLVLPLGLALVALLLFMWRRSRGNGSGRGGFSRVFKKFRAFRIGGDRPYMAEDRAHDQPGPSRLAEAPPAGTHLKSVRLVSNPDNHRSEPESHSQTNLIPLPELLRRPLSIPQPPAPAFAGASVDPGDHRAYRRPGGGSVNQNPVNFSQLLGNKSRQVETGDTEGSSSGDIRPVEPWSPSS